MIYLKIILPGNPNLAILGISHCVLSASVCGVGWGLESQVMTGLHRHTYWAQYLRGQST